MYPNIINWKDTILVRPDLASMFLLLRNTSATIETTSNIVWICRAVEKKTSMEENISNLRHWHVDFKIVISEDYAQHKDWKKDQMS